MGRPGDTESGVYDIERLTRDELKDARREVGEVMVHQHLGGDVGAWPVVVARMVARCRRIGEALEEISADLAEADEPPTPEERAQIAAFVARLEAQLAAMLKALD